MDMGIFERNDTIESQSAMEVLIIDGSIGGLSLGLSLARAVRAKGLSPMRSNSSRKIASGGSPACRKAISASLATTRQY